MGKLRIFAGIQFRDFMLLTKFAKIRCMREKLSVLQYNV